MVFEGVSGIDATANNKKLGCKIRQQEDLRCAGRRWRRNDRDLYLDEGRAEKPAVNRSSLLSVYLLDLFAGSFILMTRPRVNFRVYSCLFFPEKLSEEKITFSWETIQSFSIPALTGASSLSRSANVTNELM